MSKLLRFAAGIIFLGFTFYGYSQGQSTVRIDGNVFYAQIARTPQERAKGLMFIDSLPIDGAMLFVFESDNAHPFWMKNTKIPLDIIWIDQDRRVVDIKSDLKPCLGVDCPIERPVHNARYVLEVNAGMVKKLNIKPGDSVDFL